MDASSGSLPPLSNAAFKAALEDLELCRQGRAVDQNLISNLVSRLEACKDSLASLQRRRRGQAYRRRVSKRGISLPPYICSTQLCVRPNLPTARSKDELVESLLQRERLQSEALSRAEIQRIRLADSLHRLQRQLTQEQNKARQAEGSMQALQQQVLHLQAEHQAQQKQVQQLILARLVQEIQLSSLSSELLEAQKQAAGTTSLKARVQDLDQQLTLQRQQSIERESVLKNLKEDLFNEKAEQAWRERISYTNISPWTSAVVIEAPIRKSLLSMKLATDPQVEPLPHRLNSSAPDLMRPESSATAGASSHGSTALAVGTARAPDAVMCPAARFELMGLSDDTRIEHLKHPGLGL